MVRIRLQRVGAKKRPFYRIVASDSRKARNGRFLELLGNYNPISAGKDLNLKEDRIRYWLHCGAQPTDTAYALLAKKNIVERKKYISPK